MVKPMSSAERKNLIDNYLTELSLLAKRLCPDARIEATTEAFEWRLGVGVRLSSLANLAAAVLNGILGTIYSS